MSSLKAMIQFMNEVLKNPVGSNLLFYLAQPRIPTKAFDSKLCYDRMSARIPSAQMGPLGFAPQDTQIFNKRFNALATDNEFYRIANTIFTTRDEAVRELTAAGFAHPGFSILWAIKLFLLHHMEKVGKYYRGFQPFGGPVKAYVNSLKLVLPSAGGGNDDMGVWQINGTPTYLDHVVLQKITNEMADVLGKPAVTINTEMYMYGSRLMGRTGSGEDELMAAL